MNKIVDGVLTQMTAEEIASLKVRDDTPLTESEVFALLVRQQINTVSVDDDTALRMKSYYPTWQELVDAQFTAEKSGFKFTYGEDLYKTIPPEQRFLSNWVPGQGTESIFERIDETHKGTEKDPIPYKTNMTVYKNKYYTENGIIYRCTRDSGIPLQNKASELVGHYFEVVEG